MYSENNYEPEDDWANLLTGSISTQDKGQREQERAQLAMAEKMYQKWVDEFPKSTDSLIPDFFFPWKDLKLELPATYEQWMKKAATQLGHGSQPDEEEEETW